MILQFNHPCRWSPYPLKDYCGRSPGGTLFGAAASPIFIRYTGVWNLLWLHSAAIDYGLDGDPCEYTHIQELVIHDAYLPIPEGLKTTSVTNLHELAESTRLEQFKDLVIKHDINFDLRTLFDGIIPGGWKAMVEDRERDCRIAIKLSAEEDHERISEIIGRNLYEV